MPAISKTGLLPSFQRTDKIISSGNQLPTFDVPKFCSPAPFVLRPFAGVYNPFPYGCSVLCNHPADCEAKDVVKKAKETWAHDGRALAACEGGVPMMSHRASRVGSSHDDQLQSVPEELFRRYTETDSRPITPAPTVASVVTRSSQARRCMTPDAVCTQQGKERTMLVLDLRRSHSQETLNWFGTTIPTTTVQAPTRTPSVRSASTTSAVSPPTNRKKKTLRVKSSSNHSEVISEAQEADTEASLKLKQQVLSNVKTLGVSDGDAALTDRTAGSSTGEGDVVKRRGKKKKGKKSGKDTSKEGEKEFQGIPDPGETQVSTLGESRGGSTRPSLTPGVPIEPCDTIQPTSANPALLSFLPHSLLKQLQRQLDQETVESEFDPKRKIALEEALRTRPPVKQRYQSDELKEIKKDLAIAENNAQKWLNVPRVFSRKSSRFELPMDARAILTMKSLEYVSQCVFPSSERLVLYNQVFNLHREELDEDEQVERTLFGKNVLMCLNEVMGRCLTEMEGEQLLLRLSIQPTDTLDFRTFSGVAAVCERLLGCCPSRDQDPPHTLEMADFRSLDRLIRPLPADSDLVLLLKDIKNS